LCAGCNSLAPAFALYVSITFTIHCNSYQRALGRNKGGTKRCNSYQRALGRNKGGTKRSKAVVSFFGLFLSLSLLPSSHSTCVFFTEKPFELNIRKSSDENGKNPIYKSKHGVCLSVVTNRAGQGSQGRHPPTGPVGGPQQQPVDLWPHLSLFARTRATNLSEREDFWPRSGFGNFDLLLLLLLIAAATRIPDEISP
jgi:hypothetical protein